MPLSPSQAPSLQTVLDRVFADEIKKAALMSLCEGIEEDALLAHFQRAIRNLDLQELAKLASVFDYADFVLRGDTLPAVGIKAYLVMMRCEDNNLRLTYDLSGGGLKEYVYSTDSIVCGGVNGGEPIESPKVYDVTFDHDPIYVNHFADLQVTATVLLNGQPFVVEDGIWSINDPDVATVDENGLVTGVYPGQATLFFEKDGAFSASMGVIVRPAEYVATVTPDSVSLVVGGTEQLVATVTRNGEPYTPIDANWMTEVEEVATVDQTGLVTGVGAGVIGITYYEGENFSTVVQTTVTAE